MSSVDLVFLAIFIVVVVFFTAWEMCMHWWATGEWIGFRRLALLCGAFAMGFCILALFPQSLLARIIGWGLPIGAIVYLAIPAVKTLLGKGEKREQDMKDCGDER